MDAYRVRVWHPYPICVDSDAFEKNILSQYSHLIESCVSCFFMWNFNEYLESKFLPQKLHSYNCFGRLALECLVDSCRLRPSFCRNFIPQCEHVNGFSPVSVMIAIKGVLNRSDTISVKPTNYSRRRMWKVSDLLCVNALGQTEHA